MNRKDDNNKKNEDFDISRRNEIFERVFEEMQRKMKKTFREFPKDSIRPGRSYIHGFNMHIDSNGKPRIEEFGNIPKKEKSKKSIFSEEREPIVDVFENDENVTVTAEIPGVEKKDIDFNVLGKTVEIKVDKKDKRFHKFINLPCEVVLDSVKYTYKTGILDIEIKKKPLE